MDQDSRRSLHKLILRALQEDPFAAPAIEEMVCGFDSSGSADDVAQALEMLATLAGSELRDRVVARLQANDHGVNRRPPFLFP
ncbi:MAG: hypothetical protein WDN31_08060 [Hyphomicrobium sp.]